MTTSNAPSVSSERSATSTSLGIISEVVVLGLFVSTMFAMLWTLPKMEMDLWCMGCHFEYQWQSMTSLGGKTAVDLLHVFPHPEKPVDEIGDDPADVIGIDLSHLRDLTDSLELEMTADGKLARVCLTFQGGLERLFKL